VSACGAANPGRSRLSGGVDALKSTSAGRICLPHVTKVCHSYFMTVPRLFREALEKVAPSGQQVLKFRRALSRNLQRARWAAVEYFHLSAGIVVDGTTGGFAPYPCDPQDLSRFCHPMWGIEKGNSYTGNDRSGG
jgi:hypothetical protein